MNKFNILTLVFSLAFLAGIAQNPQGFFLDDWQAKTITSPEYTHQVEQPSETATATVTVTVDMHDTITKVNQYIYGNNAVPWAGKMNNDASMVNNIANLSPNVLRWPGGNLSNHHFWDAIQDKGPNDIPPTMSINPLNAGMNTSNWAMTTDNYYDLLKKTNSTGIICVNYSYARYGTGPDPVANAAHYAANWVRYDNGRTKFWEIGNENYGSWQAGYEIDTTLNQDGQPKFISGELYGQHSRVFIDSMKSAAAEIGSEIYIGVVVMKDLITYNSIMNKWNSGVMPQVADKADFLIAHSYYTPYDKNSNVATILNSTSHTKKIKDYVLNDLKKFSDKENLPIALTEWNIFATGSAQAVSYVNGMHATLNLGELIKNQYGSAMRWDLANGWNNGNDHGLFAGKDEPGVTPGTPHAPFYYMYYFQKYFGNIMVGTTVSGSNNIVSYASSFSTGESGVIIVNKGTTKQIVDLKVDNYTEAQSIYRYVLTGGTDNGDFSRKVFVNGEGTTQAGGGPANYETIKAYGNNINNSIKFEVPPLSVTHLLVSTDTLEKAGQSISMEPFAEITFGDIWPGYPATATSGLPISYSSSNHEVAVIQDDSIVIVGAGVTEITANQDGNENWHPATPVEMTLSVLKSGQTITFPELPEKNMGDPNFSAEATASSGLECTYESSDITVATVENGIIKIEGAGTTLITARQEGGSNYLAAEEVTRELIVHSTVGLTVIPEEKGFEIYPNPASDYITVRLHQRESEITIHNVSGAIVYRNTVSVPELIIPVRQIGGAGVYFIIINSVSAKFIVAE